MWTLVKTNIKQYQQNTNGQFGVVFALLAVPLVAISTLALDYNFAQKERLKLSSALDDTALASILDQTLSEAERADYADAYFKQFFDESKDIDLKVLESSDKRVSLVAKANVPTTMASIIGKDNITVSDTAVSKLTEGAVVCMLTLDPDGEHSFEVAHGAKFSANTCSVQVNSTHKEAAIVHNGSKASAKDFCVSGGAVGLEFFDPFVNTECGVVSDPFQYRRIPAPGTCQAPDILEEKLSDYRSEIFYPTVVWNGTALATIEGGVTLEPGTYCGGLNLSGKHIKFAPGEYIITGGPLLFGQGTKAYGEDITFVMAGKEATLLVEDGSNIDLTAPAKGDLKGLVFAQYVETELGAAGILPSAESIIRSGGTVKIVGTAYLPTQKVSFIGGSISAAQAPATSFIAHQIRIDDGAAISVDVDHQTAGLPPILPRSDESARLVE